jgi:hypothetical protein
MNMLRNRTLFSWLAILAILLNALAPAVTHALTQPNGGSGAQSAWLEVCSAQGSTWIRVGSDGGVLEQTREKPADAPGGTASPHCPYCVTHAASFAMPPSPAADFAVRAFSHELSERPGVTAISPANWLSPAARAPPFQT